jgi:sugar lactone lactonase YvrE
MPKNQLNVIRGGLLILLVVALASGCGGHGRGAAMLVFESDRTGAEALYGVHSDGSGLTKLLDLPSDDVLVFWTRGGTKALVFDYHPTSLVFEPASGSRRRIRLPRFGPASESAWSDMHWSPDGDRLAYPTDDGNIVVLDAASGARRRIAEGASDGAVAWSPDGKRLLFVDWSRDAVYTTPASGGRPARVVRLPHGVYPGALPQWSGDGRWISLFDAGQKALYVARADGTRLHSLARDAKDVAWAPSGARIAFAGDRGIVVVDLAHARRRQLTRDPLDRSLTWSPDGSRIAYTRNDLGPGALGRSHDQLWTMKGDGTDQSPVTHGFPDGGSNGPIVWVAGSVNGTPPPKLPLASPRGARTIATRLPIVALAAARKQAAVAQGLGGTAGFRGPLGPIVVWDPVRGTSSRLPIPGCGRAYEVTLSGVMFVAGGVMYRCDEFGIAYGADETLRLVRPGERGASEIIHASGGEFSGSLLGGLAGDGNAIAFDEGMFGTTAHGVDTLRSRIWKATGARKTIVRTFSGDATVASFDGGRLAVLRDGRGVSVLFRDGSTRTFAFGPPRVRGAALDGARLLVIQGTRLIVLDMRSGRRIASWPVRRGFGPTPELEGAQGDLAAYVVGVAVYVVRLSDGREIVLDAPNATGPVFARFVPSGLFYSFNDSYAKRPGRLVFVARSQLERELASKKAAR